MVVKGGCGSTFHIRGRGVEGWIVGGSMRRGRRCVMGGVDWRVDGEVS